MQKKENFKLHVLYYAVMSNIHVDSRILGMNNILHRIK